MDTQTLATKELHMQEAERIETWNQQTKDLGDDWTTGSGDIEQHELPPEDSYEGVICEVPRFWRNVTWKGNTTRREQTQIVIEIECVDKDGKRFFVSSKPGTPTFSTQSNLYAFLTKMKVDIELAKQGVQASLIGRGVRVVIEHSDPVGEAGIVYANLATYKPSDNGLTVSADYELLRIRNPDSQVQHLVDETPFD